jgi:hypothetical protein
VVLNLGNVEALSRVCVEDLSNKVFGLFREEFRKLKLS